jgi:hypothetical protein
MEINIFTPQELPVVLGALRKVALASTIPLAPGERGEHGFTEAEAALIEGLARLHGVDLIADELQAVSFDELAREVADPHRRKRVIQIAIAMALVEGPPTRATEGVVRRLAEALGLDEQGLDVLYKMTHHRSLLARFDMIRRTGRIMRNIQGFPGILGLALPILGLGGGDPELAASYRALGACGTGTLGRAFHDHFVNNHFKFPGEPGGVPLIFHDLGHVLAGYGTDPQGEIQQAAFQAGFVRHDGFSFLLFGILQFHIGMRITPIAKGYRGLFDVSRVLTALHRGACCKVDLTEGYDLLAARDRPLEEVRAELGIPPLPPAASAVPTVAGGESNPDDEVDLIQSVGDSDRGATRLG